MGLFHIATSCLRYFLQLLLALLDDEPSQGPLLGGFSPTAMETVPAHTPVCCESEPSHLLPSSASKRLYIASIHPAPPSKPRPHRACREPTLNAGALPNGPLFKQQSYMPRPSDRRAGVEETHHIEPSSSFTLCQPPCDLPILLNSELPPPSCTSMSISSRSSMVSTPVLPGWSPGTPMTPTRQPKCKASAVGGQLVGLGIQILYDDHSSRQFDGLGLVPSRMSEPDIVEEDLGVPSRILLEEIYHTFTSPDALAAAAPFPEEKDLADDETSVEDVFTAQNIATQGPSAASTPCKAMKKHSLLSYGLPTAASMRRARRMRLVETEEGDESRSSDSSASGSSAQKPAWRY
ncbi:hypothetical protein BJV78DRAFT_1251593 [Lactifluus subvellereus]|nr:hypothetical protein BJV78DRAFT_1251593 [Lactifluus subvellereus]